jgi:hypothetical protein
MGFVVKDLMGTAIDKVAHETLVAVGSRPLVNPRFGANMPIVARGEPSNSYLLYKVLLNPDNYATRDCSSGRTATSDCSGGSDNWCVLPSDCSADPATCAARIACVVDSGGTCYRAALPPGSSIAPSADELRRLRNWFAAGQPMPLPFEADGGIHAVHLGKVELRMIQSWIVNSKACTL